MYKFFNKKIATVFGFDCVVDAIIDSELVAIIPSLGIIYTYIRPYESDLVTYRDISINIQFLFFGVSITVRKTQKMASND